jgi:hypothetical protein
VEPQDFVYVLKDKMVVEHGFRYDLEAEHEQDGEGVGRKMVQAQLRTGVSSQRSTPLAILKGMSTISSTLTRKMNQ